MAFYCYGPNKALAIRELAERNGIDLERSSAYSDSATDVPMLEAVGHPVAVNPDRALAKAAARMSVPCTVATNALTSIEEIVKAAGEEEEFVEVEGEEA